MAREDTVMGRCAICPGVAAVAGGCDSAYHPAMARVMSLLEKLGLVYGGPPEAAPDAGADTAASTLPSSATPDISPGHPPKLQAAPPVPEVKLDTAAIEQAPGEQEWALEQVYASAGIQPPAHGFTVYRLIEMLEAEEFRSLDAPTRAKVIAGMLRRLPTGAVEVDDIVRDAAVRDRALDAFERFLADRVGRLAAEAEEKNRALQQEIDELTVRNTELMDANRAGVEQEKAKLERWQARKRTEEDRLFAAVQPFVEHNPVTRDEAPTVPPTGPK